MMICVVIKGPSYEEAHRQIEKAIKFADLIELRLDLFSHLDLHSLEKLRMQFSVPMIFALRDTTQGGHYSKSEANRIEDIRLLATLKPEYLDLEHHLPPEFIKDIALKYPETKIIVSYHDCEKTPVDLNSLYDKLQQHLAHYYKIAVTAQNSLDAMRLLCWVRKSKGNLIAISMGPFGQMTRILAPIMKCPFTYATIDDEQQTAPGQLPAEILLERFNYRKLTPSTKIYGLIGDPVDKSISDLTHNHIMKQHELDSVYIKMQVTADDLPHFLTLAKELPFCGLSVTMPLKEVVMPFLDHIDSKACNIGAVNTLHFQNGRIHGFNTDAEGALNAIERKLKVDGKRIVIIGAGGAAKAIIYESIQRGGHVTIVNRDAKKAEEIASKYGCHFAPLDQMRQCTKNGYDILINTTPVSMPIAPEDILPGVIVMDIKTIPMMTDLLQHAREKGCRVVYGCEMFVEQAAGQFRRWFREERDIMR